MVDYVESCGWATKVRGGNVVCSCAARERSPSGDPRHNTFAQTRGPASQRAAADSLRDDNHILFSVGACFTRSQEIVQSWGRRVPRYVRVQGSTNLLPTRCATVFVPMFQVSLTRLILGGDFMTADNLTQSCAIRFADGLVTVSKNEKVLVLT